MTSNSSLKDLSREQKLELLQSLQELDTRLKYNKAKTYYPDTGPFRRALFPKHVQFMNNSLGFLERCMLGSNRSGKSETCAFETYLHATGNYNDHPWYTGIKFNPAEDIRIWIGGVSHGDVKDIQQDKLMGPSHSIGTGLIPKDLIVDARSKSGVPGGFSEVVVRRSGGGLATISFKSYEQGRESFQGTSVHFIGLDEECPQDVYEECVTRCATVNGRIALYFTPLSGLTDTVRHFLPNGRVPEGGTVPGRSAFVTKIEWEDVPESVLPMQMRAQLEATYLPHQKEARMKGIPMIGDGKVYTTPEATCVVSPFKIPAHWPKMYAFDIGYDCSAAVWIALDELTDTAYVYDEYYSKRELPSTHVAAIKAKGGEWMSGVIDPSALQTNKHDGLTSFALYRELGLNVRLADNRVHAGIQEVTQRLSTGRLKFFTNCSNVLEEYRIYRYATNKTTGVTTVAKNQDDHAMDALRYGIMSLSIAEVYRDPDDDYNYSSRLNAHLGRNPTTGY
jgi:phage terminase large subunit-like protein